MAFFDFNKSAACSASEDADRSPAAQLDYSQALESLNQLRIALDFAAARQALTRKHMAQAQAKRDRWYQQSQFAERSESKVLRQRAQRRDEDSHAALAQLQAQLIAQAEQIASLEERILAIQAQLAQAEGFVVAPPSSPRSALMSPWLMERFTGNLEL